MITDGDYKLKLGTKAIDFSLPGVDGQTYSLASFSGSKLLVVVFSCNHCPYVQSYEDRMIETAREYAAQGVAFVAINSNDDSTHTEDSFDEMVKRAKQKGFPFAYVRDASQQTARAYGAVCTPHFLVFDSARTLRYQGRFDDDRWAKNIKSNDLLDALDSLLAGEAPSSPLTLAFGCSIKWRAA